MKHRKPPRVGALVSLPCGCQHDDVRWWNMCETHRAECRDIHERAQARFRGVAEGLIPREPKP